MKIQTPASLLNTFCLLLAAPFLQSQSVSLTGVVYQNNTAQILFSVPEGKINVYLPDDMAAGDRITGTVAMEVSGKNDKEKTKNLDLLKQYVIKIGDAVLDATTLKAGSSAGTGRFAGNFNLPDKWWGIAHNVAPVSLTLMKEPVANVQMPLVKINTSPAEFKSVPGPKAEQEGIEFKPLKKVITSNERIVIQSISNISIPFDMKETQTFSWDINDQRVAPICSSPRQTIIAVPPETIGKTSITAKDKNGNIVYSGEVYVVDIRASIDKQNLRKNERTGMQTEAAGINDCPYPVSMTIVNKTTETILLDKGAHQTYFYNPGEKNKPGYAPLTIRQGVTGVTPGVYDITASLILPSYTFGDVFHQQKSALKTPEDYNAWADALKKDLKAYADKQGNDDVGKAARDNAERAIGNIPKCNDKSKLDECKAFADAFLRPVNVPKGAATMWVCGYEAYKAAIKAITGTLGGKPELIDWEVIKNGLEVICNMGEQLKDKELQNGANHAKKLVEAIQKAGETKEKLQELNEKLDELNEGINGRISTKPSQVHTYQMQDLLLSTFMGELPLCRTMDGTTAMVTIDNNPAEIYSLSRTSGGAYDMEVSASSLATIFRSLSPDIIFPDKPVQFSITGPNVQATKPVVDFKNALITELEFPKLDAETKNNAWLKIKIRPETINYTATGSTIRPADANKGKQWLQSNFKFQLADLPCKNISKIESFKITPKSSEPGKMEISELKIFVPESDIKSWRDWFDAYVKTDETRNGSFTIVDERGTHLFTLPLNNVKPGGVIYENPSGDKTYGIVLRPGEIVKPPAESTKDERVSKNDMIAFFSPASKTLFYLPEYKTQIFDKFKPNLRADGKYDISLFSMNRKSIRTVIDIVPASLLDLLNQYKKDSIKYDKNGFESTGELIMEKWDSTSATWYRFYKDAKCKRWKEPKEGECFQDDLYDADGKLVVKDGKPVLSGKSHKTSTTGESHCYKGIEFCTEIYIVAIIEYIYDDANCKRLVKVKTYGGWSCE